MTRTKIRNKLDEIYDSMGPVPSSEVVEEANRKAEELLDKECHKITVHAPTLDTNTMRPKMELCNCKCPNGKDGQCQSCNMFVTYKNDTGTVFAFMQFDGYCAKEEEK